MKLYEQKPYKIREAFITFMKIHGSWGQFKKLKRHTLAYSFTKQSNVPYDNIITSAFLGYAIDNPRKWLTLSMRWNIELGKEITHVRKTKTAV